jgi:NitT/TauT family transport system substrate-binding protein
MKQLSSLGRMVSMVIVIALLSGMGLNVRTSVQAAQDAPISEENARQDITEVRVGVVPVMIFAPLFIADANGYFADENIIVDIQRSAGGSEPLAPLASGDLDVIFGGAGAGLFNYANRNLDLDGDPGFRIVAGVHSEREPLTSPLVVSRERFENGEITSVSDLEGGRVAINATGAATEYWLAQALELGGISIDDVEVVAVSFSDVPAALNSDSADRIDAAILGEPLVSFAENEGLVVRLSDDFIDGFQATFLYMSNDFIENNREAAVGFITAYVRASRYLADDETWDSDEVAAILEEYTSVPAAINQSASRPYFPLDGEVNVENLETLQEYFAAQEETLSYEGLMDVTVMIDDTLLEDVITELGPYEMDGDSPDATEEPSS